MFITNDSFIAMDSPPSPYHHHYHHDPTTVNIHTLLKSQAYRYSNSIIPNARSLITEQHQYGLYSSFHYRQPHEISTSQLHP